MTNRKKRHPAFCLYRTIESGKQRPLEAAVSAANINLLFFEPRNMSGGKLLTAITLDQRVRELHDSIERFAVRCSFDHGFTDNNCRVIAVKAR